MSEVMNSIVVTISAAADKDKVIRGIAVAMLPVVKTRIHEEGKDANDTQIGTYSPGYMKVRTGDFANATKTKKGKKKDSGTFTDRTIRLNKESGIFTGEDKVGKARPKHNRSSDTKVVASLTRQMENDFSVIETPDGYGLGYNNDLNAQKSQWVEETYDKPIFSLTNKELDVATDVASELSVEFNG